MGQEDATVGNEWKKGAGLGFFCVCFFVLFFFFLEACAGEGGFGRNRELILSSGKASFFTRLFQC